MGVKRTCLIGVAQTTARTALEAMPDAESFQSGFDALPQGAQTAVFRELALTPRHRGTERDALDRLDRIEASMSPSDLEAAETWLENQTPKQMTAILKALAARS